MQLKNIQVLICQVKDEDGLRDVCQQLGIHADKTMGKGKLIDEIFSAKNVSIILFNHFYY